MAILTSVRWYFIVVLTCISFITDDIELLSSTFWQFVFLWLLLLLFSCSNSCADYLQLHGLHHARLLCPSLSRVVWSNSCSLSQWCHPTVLSSVTPFSSWLQSFPESGSFLKNQLYALGGRSIGASASVLPTSIQCWFPLGLTGLILQSTELFFNGPSQVLFYMMLTYHSSFFLFGVNLICFSIL